MYRRAFPHIRQLHLHRLSRTRCAHRIATAGSEGNRWEAMRWARLAATRRRQRRHSLVRAIVLSRRVAGLPPACVASLRMSGAVCAWSSTAFVGWHAVVRVEAEPERLTVDRTRDKAASAFRAADMLGPSIPPAAVVPAQRARRQPAGTASAAVGISLRWSCRRYTHVATHADVAPLVLAAHCSPEVRLPRPAHTTGRHARNGGPAQKKAIGLTGSVPLPTFRGTRQGY